MPDSDDIYLAPLRKEAEEIDATIKATFEKLKREAEEREAKASKANRDLAKMIKKLLADFEAEGFTHTEAVEWGMLVISKVLDNAE